MRQCLESFLSSASVFREQDATSNELRALMCSRGDSLLLAEQIHRRHGRQDERHLRHRRQLQPGFLERHRHRSIMVAAVAFARIWGIAAPSGWKRLECYRQRQTDLEFQRG
jgi:hypothetical protein